jgi:hypothetical protein
VNRVLAAVFASVLGVLVAVVPAAPAQAADCTTVWLTAPTINEVLPAGRKRCIDLTDTVSGGAIIRVYSYDTKSKGQIDWLDAWAFTRTRPNGGRVQSTADWIRYLARVYDVKLQFANRDMAGRLGCSGGFIDSVSGAYQPSPRHPGKGLVRIGTGITDRCMADKRTAANVARHEFGHVHMERICGTTRPPIAGSRVEQVATAYAVLYFSASMNAGGIEPSSTDLWRAKQIHAGNCG